MIYRRFRAVRAMWYIGCYQQGSYISPQVKLPSRFIEVVVRQLIPKHDTVAGNSSVLHTLYRSGSGFMDFLHC